jgi:hypothetical protein
VAVVVVSFDDCRCHVEANNVGSREDKKIGLRASSTIQVVEIITTIYLSTILRHWSSGFNLSSFHRRPANSLMKSLAT